MKAWTWALALGLLAGCSPIWVKYDYDPHSRATLQAYKSYDWYAAGPQAKGQAEGMENPIMDRRVRRIVEREMAARGFQKQTTGEPDFLLTYYPVYQNRVYQTYTAMGPAWGWGRPWGYGVAGGVSEVQSVREGSIVLEVVDRKTNQMVWQAVAGGALTGIEDPKDAEDQVTEAVRKMLSKFPPPPVR